MFTTSEFILQNLLPQSILCPSSELTTQKHHHPKSAHEPHCEFREADLNIALSINIPTQYPSHAKMKRLNRHTWVIQVHVPIERLEWVKRLQSAVLFRLLPDGTSRAETTRLHERNVTNEVKPMKSDPKNSWRNQ